LEKFITREITGRTLRISYQLHDFLQTKRKLVGGFFEFGEGF
jgi:hypothetical protein